MADDDIRTQLARDPEMERAKQWWREHGRAIVAGVALGLAGVVGFNVWQGHQQGRAENASNLYQQLRIAVVAADAAAAAADAAAADADTADTDADADADADDTDDTADDTVTDDTVTDDTDTDDTDTDDTDTAIAAAQIQTLADQLMNDFAATPYALHAALALAKQRVAADDLAAAADALRWAVDNADDDGLRHIARLRLASVLLAQDDAAAALALLAVDDTGGFAARYSELTGDAHLQTGDTVSARDAYNKSLDAGGGALLRLKLDNL